MPEKKLAEHVAGAVTVTSNMMLFVYAIVNTPGEKGWTSVWTIGTAAAAFALLGAFIMIERQREGAAGSYRSTSSTPGR